MSLKPFAIAAAVGSTMAFTGLAFTDAASAAAHTKCGVIKIGSAISLTGKYATAGGHAKAGYDFAVKKIAHRFSIRQNNLPFTER